MQTIIWVLCVSPRCNFFVIYTKPPDVYFSVQFGLYVIYSFYPALPYPVRTRECFALARKDAIIDIKYLVSVASPLKGPEGARPHDPSDRRPWLGA